MSSFRSLTSYGTSPISARETRTGQNLTATGDPKATLMVVYTIDAGRKKVTITVDQYRSPRDALSLAMMLSPDSRRDGDESC